MRSGLFRNLCSVCKIMKAIFGKAVLFSAVCFFAEAAALAETFVVASPNGRLEAAVSDDGGELKFGVVADGKTVVEPFKIGLKTSLCDIGTGAKISLSDFDRIDETVVNPNGIRREVRDACTQKKFLAAKNCWLVVRAYDDAVAYRFETRLGDSDMIVENESFSLPLADDTPIIAHPLKGVAVSFESPYHFGKVADMKKMHTAMLPFLFRKNGYVVALVESDVRDYPSMRLAYSEGDKCPRAFFSKYPKRFFDFKKYEWQAAETEDFIAKTNGIRKFPWRAFIVADSESKLAANDLVFRLAEPSKISDDSWITRGLSLWDWWNNWSLTGVDFESGINLDTYKYYVDFAAEHSIPWIVVDTGWLNGAEIGRVSHEDCDEMFMREELFLDVPAIIKYAHSKNVKVMPWILARTLVKYGDAAFKKFAEWGADGLKIDFIDRDDQLAVRDTERLARLAAKYKMVVDFHGCTPPAGLQRTYPNVLNFEGVLGCEATKWRRDITPEHNITLAYVRMLAGPMDYTPGAMNNRNAKTYSVCYDLPQIQATRSHVVAQYVIFHAPFQMMCDSPSAYLASPETLKFISSIPTVWDETKVVDGEIGKYVVLARRKGDVWYLAGMGDRNGRTVEADLSKILPQGEYVAEFFTDTPNSAKIATDFKRATRKIKSGDTLKIKMESCGGFAVRLVPESVF